MDFYNFFSKYYDDIFKPDRDLADFIGSSLRQFSDVKLLDIGCATGGYSGLFKDMGFSINGIDLSEKMIEIAKLKFPEGNPEFSAGDMKMLLDYFNLQSFDSVLILGNTLVHLTDNQALTDFINSVYAVMKTNGLLFIQLLNYDYLLGNRITDLPDISGVKVFFRRWYEYTGGKEIMFYTEITELSTAKKYSASIRINPVRKKEIEDILTASGFMNISTFSGSGKQYVENSMSILVSAVR